MNRLSKNKQALSFLPQSQSGRKDFIKNRRKTEKPWHPETLEEPSDFRDTRVG